MNAEWIREYCLRKNAATESLPFGEDTLVFKVNDKIFCLLSLDQQPPRINVKCNPELAHELREQHSFVIPGYHMNKKHWNTIVCEEFVSEKLVKEWIDHSYDLITKRSNGKLKVPRKN